GGLVVLAVVALGVWRRHSGGDRVGMVRTMVTRFGTVALAAAAVVVVTGTLNAALDLAHPGDLWHTTYGRVITAKVGVLVLALVLAAVHRWLVPSRLAATGG